ncbi:uroporphyrinogen decarboxylase [Anaerolineae bacterium]|nr:uroporphyrinogen decarboxylase [Anaerolineae bacterium]
MNSRERVARAMRHQPVDRVPVMCQLALGHYFLNAGIAPHRIWFTSEGFAEALVTLQQRYRFDGILINLPGRPANVLDDVISIEMVLGGERLTWRDGGVTFVPNDENPQHEPTTRADFETTDPDHLDAIGDLPGYVWNTYHIPRVIETRGVLREIPDYFFRTLDLVKRAVGDTVSIHGEVFSPFTHYMELFGYEQALMSLLADPGKAHALLDRLTDASIAWAVAQARRGVDAVLISSAFAGGSLISTQMYREFVIPYERQVTEAVKAVGVPIYTHTCGRIGDRLELMAETGTQGIDTLDPPPLGNVELAEAKRRIGDKLFIKGNLNSVALLAYETHAQVIAEATERIRIGKIGGGYILSTACSVAPHVEPWKLVLLAPLAEEIGRG